MESELEALVEEGYASEREEKEMRAIARCQAVLSATKIGLSELSVSF